MGLIKAATSMIGGGLADQWVEVIEPDDMSDTSGPCLSKYDDASRRWWKNHRLYC